MAERQGKRAIAELKEQALEHRRADRYPLFLALLVADVGLLLIVPAGTRAMLFVAPFVAGTLLLGLYTSDAKPRTMRIAAVAGALVVVAAVVAALTDQPGFASVAWFMLAALVVATPWTILRHVFSERGVTLRTILAAVSVYVLIGLAFAFIDLGIQNASGTFFAQTGTHPPSDFIYFSYIAMTTVGFGDLTPATNLPRAVTVFEAILGQIFLVTTVARLVSLYGMEQSRPVPEAKAELHPPQASQESGRSG
jgi:hypothetical protein